MGVEVGASVAVGAGRGEGLGRGDGLRGGDGVLCGEISVPPPPSDGMRAASACRDVAVIAATAAITDRPAIADATARRRPLAARRRWDNKSVLAYLV